MKTNLKTIFSVVKGILRTEENWGKLIPIELIQKETNMSKDKIKPILNVLIDEKFIISPKEEFYLRVD